MLSLPRKIDVNSQNRKIIKQLGLHIESNRYLRHLSVIGVTGIKGAEFIAKGIAVSASLTSIDLSHNRLGSEGGKCVAEGIAVSASLTEVLAF